ncbi:MAG: hypothetical protein JJE04_11340 [Acidobacteriia bacterium]|nr:hypothetical protein [Terriglobia bacterium]
MLVLPKMTGRLITAFLLLTAASFAAELALDRLFHLTHLEDEILTAVRRDRKRAANLECCRSYRLLKDRAEFSNTLRPVFVSGSQTLTIITIAADHPGHGAGSPLRC